VALSDLLGSRGVVAGVDGGLVQPPRQRHRCAAASRGRPLGQDEEYRLCNVLRQVRRTVAQAPPAGRVDEPGVPPDQLGERLLRRLP
jgi:hypothetical protein